MTTNIYRESAKIYDIFSGNRIGALDDQQIARPAAEHPFERAPNTVAGGAWYHEAAIRDEAAAHNRWRG